MGTRHEHVHPAVQIQRQPHPRQHQHRPGSAAAFRWSIILNSALSGLQLAIGLAFGHLHMDAALFSDAYIERFPHRRQLWQESPLVGTALLG